jgi:hypothetical protein
MYVWRMHTARTLLYLIAASLFFCQSAALYAADSNINENIWAYGDIETVIPEEKPPSLVIPGQPLRATEEGTCRPPEYTSEYPFLISVLAKDYDAQPRSGRKITEPLFYDLPDGKVASKGVPAFSILQLLFPQNLLSDSTQPLLPQVSIEVLSLPNENAILEMRTNRRLAGAAKALPLAEEGTQGRFRTTAIQFIQQFVFKVKDQKILQHFPEIQPLLTDASIHFVEQDGRFLARECCRSNIASRTSKLKDSAELLPACRKEYVFEVRPDNQPDKVLKRYFDNTYKNEMFSGLFPIQKHHINSLAKILELIEEPEFDFIDFRYFDTRGFVKIPLEAPDQFRTTTGQKILGMQRGPLKTLHYKSDDPNANDAFGHPTSICAFLQAVKAHNKTCTTPNCQIQWGDFYHSDAWYTHQDHVHGSCVDIRPMRKKEGYGPLGIWSYVKRCKKLEDGTQSCTNVRVLNSLYDRAKTQQLVQTLAAAGGVGKAEPDGTVKIQNILFNDPQIKGVRSSRGHDNHLHVCFPPQNEKVISACLQSP